MLLVTPSRVRYIFTSSLLSHNSAVTRYKILAILSWKGWSSIVILAWNHNSSRAPKLTGVKKRSELFWSCCTMISNFAEAPVNSSSVGFSNSRLRWVPGLTVVRIDIRITICLHRGSLAFRIWLNYFITCTSRTHHRLPVWIKLQCGYIKQFRY